MGDSSVNGDPWAAYLDRAAERVGGISELSRRSTVHRGTIHDWQAKPGSGRKVTVEYVVMIANGSGDDAVNAFRAAAGLTADIEIDDPEIRTVLDGDLPREATEKIIADIWARRERNRQRDMQETQSTIQLARLLGDQSA